LSLVEEADVKGEIIETDIDDLVLTLLEIFYSGYFVDIDANFTLLEGQVGEKLHYFGKHNVAISEDGLWEL
jgi:hypothetical protein